MTAKERLEGIDLVDCARANAAQGLQVAAELCGYGDDTAAFEQALTAACRQMGVTFNDLRDLVTHPRLAQRDGVEIAPDSSGNL